MAETLVIDGTFERDPTGHHSGRIRYSRLVDNAGSDAARVPFQDEVECKLILTGDNRQLLQMPLGDWDESKRGWLTASGWFRRSEDGRETGRILVQDLADRPIAQLNCELVGDGKEGYRLTTHTLERERSTDQVKGREELNEQLNRGEARNEPDAQRAAREALERHLDGERSQINQPPRPRDIER